MTDTHIQIINQNSLVGFHPRNDHAKDRLRCNTYNLAEGWQWIGNTLWVEHERAPVIIEVLREEGLI